MTKRAVAHMQRAQEYLSDENYMRFGGMATHKGSRAAEEECVDIITTQVENGCYRHISSRTFVSRLHYCALLIWQYSFSLHSFFGIAGAVFVAPGNY